MNQSMRGHREGSDRGRQRFTSPIRRPRDSLENNLIVKQESVELTTLSRRFFAILIYDSEKFMIVEPE